MARLERPSDLMKYKDFLTFSTEFPTPMKVNKTGKNNKMVYISFYKIKLNLNIFSVDGRGQGIVK